MTNFKPDDDLAEWDAAYVLGALSLEDRRTYENYLAANPARAAELTDLAGMPGILNALSRDEAVALTDLAGAPPVAGSARQRRVAGARGSQAAAAVATHLAHDCSCRGGCAGDHGRSRGCQRLPAVAGTGAERSRCRRCSRPRAVA